MDLENWQPVIGLEIHVQLATRSKIFSASPTAYGAAPNTQASAIDIGLPGVLPVLNQAALVMAIKFGLAVDARIAKRSIFARKNYFYPDLPKGYQISQYETPVLSGGYVPISIGDETRHVGVTRAHLEEDAGKSIHDALPERTGIDLNRAGTPLLEIVSEPEMHSAEEAVAYMRQVHAIVRYLDICDGNLQEGSFRCDANVSIRRLGEPGLGTRTELKNLNSFRFVDRAIRHEIHRQIDVLEGGGTVVQQTRHYDPTLDKTRPLRNKEEANDYRYFPDPDLLPVEISDAFIASVRAALPELPDARFRRFTRDYLLDKHAARLLTSSRELADYFEDTLRASGGEGRSAANWITGELHARLKRETKSISRCPVTPDMLGGLLRRIEDGTVSGQSAREVLDAMWDAGGSADEIIKCRGMQQVSDDDALANLVDVVLKENPEQVRQFRAGRHKVLAYLVGQAMQISKGRANPRQISVLMRTRLDE